MLTILDIAIDKAVAHRIEGKITDTDGTGYLRSPGKIVDRFIFLF